MTIKQLFDKHDGEFIRFERIPEYAKPYKNRDLCAFVYLVGKLPCNGDIVCSCNDNEIFLGFSDIEKLTEEDVIYISRCGVRYDSQNDMLCMFT